MALGKLASPEKLLAGAQIKNSHRTKQTAPRTPRQQLHSSCLCSVFDSPVQCQYKFSPRHIQTSCTLLPAQPAFKTVSEAKADYQLRQCCFSSLAVNIGHKQGQNQHLEVSLEGTSGEELFRHSASTSSRGTSVALIGHI